MNICFGVSKNAAKLKMSVVSVIIATVKGSGMAIYAETKSKCY